MSIAHMSRRKMLTSFVAAFTAASGFASSSCASPRFPTGGYPLRSYAGGYELQVLVDGAPAPTYDYAGETYVLGQMGARYTLRVVNHTGKRIEAVVSVDGRDAIDGKSADARSKRGYLVAAWGSADIDGWRLSRAEVAAFRFSSVADSYAARTGTAREVGVIGVAVFPERALPPPRPVYVPQRTYPRYYQSPGWRGFEERDDARELGATPPSHREAYRDNYSSGGGADKKSSQPSLGNADASPAPTSPSAASPSPSPAPPSRSPAPPSRSPAPRSPSPPRAASAPASDSASLLDSLSEGEPAPRRRPGLGTEFGEAVTSPVQEVTFVRANGAHPAVVLGARYNDRDGLVALGINVDGCCMGDDDLAWRQTATPFPAADRRYAAPPTGWQQGCCVRY